MACIICNMEMRTLKTESDVLADLHGRVKQFGRQSVVARELGFTPQYICDVLKGNRPVSTQLAKALGYERMVVFSLASKRNRKDRQTGS